MEARADDLDIVAVGEAVERALARLLSQPGTVESCLRVPGRRKRKDSLRALDAPHRSMKGAARAIRRAGRALGPLNTPTDRALNLDPVIDALREPVRNAGSALDAARHKALLIAQPGGVEHLAR